MLLSHIDYLYVYLYEELRKEKPYIEKYISLL